MANPDGSNLVVAASIDTTKPITVRISVDDLPQPLTFDSWAKAIEEKLLAAGIPLLGSGVAHGALKTYGDPKDFGVTVYEWYPMSAIVIDRGHDE
jgi:predicted metal-dependent phosphoesterase TrpH